MKTLQLISSAGHYGAENMLLNLAKSLERLGCTCVLGVFENLHRPNTEIAEHAQQLGLQTVAIRCQGRADREAVRAIRSHIETQGIDLVHTHGYKADIYGYAAARTLPTPLIATCHNWTSSSVSLRLYAMLDRWALRRFHRAVAVSEGVAVALRRGGVAPEKITTISNGVDVAVFSAGRPTLAAEIGKGNRLVVGMVSRLVRGKGADYFLRAASDVLSCFPETLFVLVGEGSARKELERLAGELGIENKVIFTGQRADMPGVYASLDVFVLPSLNEGMPLTVLEAQAANRAVIGSRVGAVPQLIQHRETGLLIEPGDVASLRNAMLELLADASLRAGLAARGQARVREHYSAESMARRYLSLYEDLLGGRARQSQGAVCHVSPIAHESRQEEG